MSADALLTAEEARVLGCLLEKERTTPDVYPMTLNALVTAANQSSNREPVMGLEEAAVEAALNGLRQKKMAAMIHVAGSRAPKYKHLLEEYFPALGRPELALLAVLLLRGPQTAAELRTRTERLWLFRDGEAAEEGLRKLCEYGNGPLAVLLPAGGGRRVTTYAHLLCGDPATVFAVAPHAVVATVIPPPADWRAETDRQLSELRTHVSTLEERLAALEKALGGA